MKLEQQEQKVAAACPVCKLIIPMFTVRLHQSGFLGRRIRVEVEGEATDWVAHMWSHNDVR
ncbi:MAG TPA: hypothetical protein VIG24_10285 [Acidimicrobiia bacterium]